MATNNCPRCASSGCGACDDFPKCQDSDVVRPGEIAELSRVFNLDMFDGLKTGWKMAFVYEVDQMRKQLPYADEVVVILRTKPA